MEILYNFVTTFINEFINKEKSFIMDFWYMNPLILFKNFDLMPSKKMNRSDFSNCIMRLGLYLGSIMFLLGISLKSVIIFIIIIGVLSIMLTGGLIPDDIEHFEDKKDLTDNIYKIELDNNSSEEPIQKKIVLILFQIIIWIHIYIKFCQ